MLATLARKGVEVTLLRLDQRGPCDERLRRVSQLVRIAPQVSAHVQVDLQVSRGRPQIADAEPDDGICGLHLRHL